MLMARFSGALAVVKRFPLGFRWQRTQTKENQLNKLHQNPRSPVARHVLY